MSTKELNTMTDVQPQSLFGTDGIRGMANQWPMTAELAMAVGRATAHICRRHSRRHRILIGKDTRLSGYMLEHALTAGICSMGVDVELVGPIPTPGIAFLTHSMRADAGIVISASHNPFRDNGIKIFSGDGFKISDMLEAEIEGLVASGHLGDSCPTAEGIGKAHRIEDALGRYIVFCKNTFPGNLRLDGLKLVLDCGNGATYKAAPLIFYELGADVIALNDKPDGRNINDNCGSQFTDALAARVRETGANVGLAFDGDGDRLIVVDEHGTTLTGDHVLAICARDMLEQDRLTNRHVVVTPMSNQGLRVALDDMGITHEDADVGDRNVLARMMATGASLGGEQSGHIIFTDYHTTGDGIVSGLQLLAIMQRTGQPLSILASMMQLMPQVLINIPVTAKPAFTEIESLQATTDTIQEDLSGNGRVMIRYSGTELLCRVMVECTDERQTGDYAERLADIIRTAIGQ